jgi:predicted metal-dependent peptidase
VTLTRGKKGPRQQPAGLEDFERGIALLEEHPALGRIRAGGICIRPDCADTPRHGLAAADSNGAIHVNVWRRASPEDWCWAVAHARLHLGFGHLPADTADRPQPDEADRAARCAVVNRFLAAFTIPSGPLPVAVDGSGADEQTLAEQWRRDGIPPAMADGGTAGPDPDQILVPWRHAHALPPDWTADFARTLSRAITAAVEVAAGARPSMDHGSRPRKAWDLALGWFVSSYPLLGSIAAGMKLVADADLARAQEIHIAAVDASLGEIYVNPLAVHSSEEWRFILAHEMLHAALRHGERAGGRDPYLWNVAADFVINTWLVEMGVGTMPDVGLHDPELAGLSAEEVYDRITTDLRRMRKLMTLRGSRGPGLGDILGEPLPRSAASRGGGVADLDDFYRRALLAGLVHHRNQGRGLLPAGLEQAIRALEHPPLKWDAQLARWFDEFLPRVEPLRSYARPSRRQSATPDIPRPGRHHPEEITPRVTFGVVLDTSGSMPVELLGKALGAIASFAASRDVPAARVVYCDAVAYDAGYLRVEDIAGKVRVKGRGGTQLQPAVHLLERAKDFPDEAPILIITDGFTDVLSVRREHAYLLPAGASLPFTPRGPVFRVR